MLNKAWGLRDLFSAAPNEYMNIYMVLMFLNICSVF